MIAIVNISKNPSRTGIHQYEVRINLDPIVQFEHRREDGLAECLKRASEAVERVATDGSDHTLLKRRKP
jgi:hypothetical protein